MNPAADAFNNMQIIFHIGVHCTDENQISSCLGQNRAVLAENGICVPPPGKFRPILRETLAAVKGGKATPEVQNVAINSILAGAERPTRMIFSNDAFLCGVQKVLDRNSLYPDAGPKCRKLYNLFHDFEVEFCLAVRNPATFLPACFSRTGGESFEAYIAQADPMAMRWSNVVQAIRQELPRIPLKIWSNEDTPFIWPELMQELTDLGPVMKMRGLDDFLTTIMKPEGLERMKSYLETHPPANEMQRRRIVSAFLDKFEIEDPALDVEAPIWTRDYLEELTDNYEEDLFAIERLPGVRFISP